MIMIYHLYCSTDFVPDPQVRELVGWSMIVMTTLIITYKVSILFLELIWRVYRKVRLWVQKRRNLSRLHDRLKNRIIDLELAEIKAE